MQLRKNRKIFKKACETEEKRATVETVTPVHEYDENKFYRIINNTQSNYANQLRRLTRNSKRSSYIIIYYSVSLIIYSLSIKFFPAIFNSNVTSFAGIVLSIVVLVYSIINGNSRYSERISSVQSGLNKMKSLKRALGKEGNFEEVKAEYENTVNNIEVREDIDFYYTVIQLCKQYGISRWTGKDLKEASFLPKEDEKYINSAKNEIRGYLTEIHPLKHFVLALLLEIWYVVLFVIPIIVFSFCILSKFFYSSLFS